MSETDGSVIAARGENFGLAGQSQSVQKKIMVAGARRKCHFNLRVEESQQVRGMLSDSAYVRRYSKMQRDVEEMVLMKLYEAYRGEYGSFLNAKHNKRGIAFDRSSLGDFRNFILHLGPKVEPLDSVDRINNALGYEAGNLRWATKQGQAENRRTTKWIAWDGNRYTHKRFAKFLGIPFDRLRQQVRRGWPLSRIVESANKSSDPLRDWKFDVVEHEAMEQLYRRHGAFGMARIDFMLTHLGERLKKERRHDQRRDLSSRLRYYEEIKEQLRTLSEGLDRKKTDELLALLSPAHQPERSATLKCSVPMNLQSRDRELQSIANGNGGRESLGYDSQIVDWRETRAGRAAFHVRLQQYVQKYGYRAASPLWMTLDNECYESFGAEAWKNSDGDEDQLEKALSQWVKDRPPLQDLTSVEIDLILAERASTKLAPNHLHQQRDQTNVEGKNWS